MDLTGIQNPEFLKTMNITELTMLAADIRRFLIDNISRTGGHLASNLGVVELTIALHYVFDAPKDKIFFDVGHQSYTHKILTGRAKYFDQLRQYHGLSGFQKRSESIYDAWEAGHSSTSCLQHSEWQLPAIFPESLIILFQSSVMGQWAQANHWKH